VAAAPLDPPKTWFDVVPKQIRVIPGGYSAEIGRHRVDVSYSPAYASAPLVDFLA
jgi:hypothetical protein